MPPTDLDDAQLYRNDHFQRAMGRTRIARAMLGRDAVAQEVRIALFKARRRFDPEHGTSFDTFAWRFVRVGLSLAAFRGARPSHLATRDPQKVYAFVRRVGVEGPVSPSVVREAFPQFRRVPDDEVHRVIDWCRGADVSFEEPDVFGNPIGDGVAGEGADDVERATHEREAHREIARLAERVGLDALQWEILRERILSDDPKTLDDIGRVMGVSGERVRQKQNTMLSRMREELLRTGHPWATQAGRTQAA